MHRLVAVRALKVVASLHERILGLQERELYEAQQDARGANSMPIDDDPTHVDGHPHVRVAVPDGHSMPERAAPQVDVAVIAEGLGRRSLPDFDSVLELGLGIDLVSMEAPACVYAYPA